VLSEPPPDFLEGFAQGASGFISYIDLERRIRFCNRGYAEWFGETREAIIGRTLAGLDPISLNVIADLIRTLNDALGATSIVVTYDVHEAVRLADYLYLIGDGRIVGHGPTPEMLASTNPFVHQFLHAEPDGPVHFHFPARPFAEELALDRAA